MLSALNLLCFSHHYFLIEDLLALVPPLFRARHTFLFVIHTIHNFLSGYHSFPTSISLPSHFPHRPPFPVPSPLPHKPSLLPSPSPPIYPHKNKQPHQLKSFTPLTSPPILIVPTQSTTTPTTLPPPSLSLLLLPPTAPPNHQAPSPPTSPTPPPSYPSRRSMRGIWPGSRMCWLGWRLRDAGGAVSSGRSSKLLFRWFRWLGKTRRTSGGKRDSAE